MRNVVRTINELPVNYAGHLTILLNDRQPMIVVRNILLLFILGTISDSAEAAEVALHFWYSAFVPMTHKTVLSSKFMQLAERLQDSSLNIKLGEQSLMTGAISTQTLASLFMLFKSDLPLGNASNEIHRVRFVVVFCYDSEAQSVSQRFEPSRVDRHHRDYCRMEPSHRLASLEFRRFGLVYPFGAANNHFNSTNTFLFSSDGRWLQSDMATPLLSWKCVHLVVLQPLKNYTHADLQHRGCNSGWESSWRFA